MAKKSVARARASERTSPMVIGGLVVIAVLVVLVLIQAGRQDDRAAVPTIPAPTGMETGLTAEGHYYRGSLDAKVVLVEYEDLRCPFCRRFFTDTEPQIVEQYVRQGLVREESRLIAILGSPSVSAAEAAHCAGEQGKFWEFRHVAFTNQPLESNPDGQAHFVKYAESVGVDIPRYTACFDTQRYRERLTRLWMKPRPPGWIRPRRSSSTASSTPGPSHSCRTRILRWASKEFWMPQ